MERQPHGDRLDRIEAELRRLTVLAGANVALTLLALGGTFFH